jgi:hypothetical protein
MPVTYMPVTKPHKFGVTPEEVSELVHRMGIPPASPHSSVPVPSNQSQPPSAQNTHVTPTSGRVR